MADDIFTIKRNLAEIWTVMDKIISMYSLEKHVWADSNSEANRKARKPELKTINEFQIDPAQPVIADILCNIVDPVYEDENKYLLVFGSAFQLKMRIFSIN